MSTTRLSLLVGILLNVSFSSYAQFTSLRSLFTPHVTTGGTSTPDLGVDMANMRTDIIPHSPEAESLGKFGVLPVTLFSGMPSISVPIFEIKTPTLDLPFALSYSYNGYKPNEIPSWVGMGWTLEGGGVITRVVKNMVDESMGTGDHYDDYIDINSLVWNQLFLTELATKQVDSEPDIYIFHVGGYSGKFIMLKGQAYLFPYQNLRIVPDGGGFKMTDDKGNNYIFTSSETTHTKTMTPGYSVPDHSSAWFVTQIISADTKDTVAFNYQTYTYVEPTNYIETYRIDGSVANNLNTSGHTYTEYAVSGNHIDGLLLTSVSSRYGSINFNPSTSDRLDLIGSTGAKYLDNIVVDGSDGSYSKFIRLSHGYFGSGSNLRLNLQSVAIEQSSGPTDSAKYSFQYAGTTTTLPANGTKGIDMYGYYNGQDGNAMLFPSGTFTPALYTYGNRSANSSYSQLGILNQVTYPTGGYTQLTYEQNQSGVISYKTALDTGTAVATYTIHDTLPNGTTSNGFYIHLDSAQWVKVSMSPHIDNYTGTLSLFTIVTGTQINGVGGTLVYASPSGQDFLADSVFIYPGDYTVFIYAPSVDQSITGSAIYHVHVVDQNSLADGPGLRVKNITSYNYDGTPQFTKQYSYNYGSGFSGGGVTGSTLFANCSNYSIVSYMAALKGALSEFSQEQFYYQQVDETTQDSSQTGKTDYTYSALGGLQLDVKLTSKTDYIYKNGNFLPLKSSSTQYQTTQVVDFTGTEVMTTTVIGPVCSGCLGCIQLASPDQTQPSDLLTIYAPSGFTDMQSVYTLPVHETETEYDSTGATALQNQSDYYYDNPSHQYPTRIITTNSKGLQQTTVMKYPLDYILGQPTTLDSLNRAFIAGLGAAEDTLDVQYGNEIAQMLPYQPYHLNTVPADVDSLTAIASRYHIESNFKTNIAAAVTQRTTAWNSYLAFLDSAMAANPVTWQDGALWMERNNMVSPVIEKYITLKEPDSNVYLISAIRNEYNIFQNAGSIKTVLPAQISQVELTAPLLYSTFTGSPDTYYKPQVDFGYDNRFNLAVQNKVYGKRTSYLWNYQDVYPVAQVTNADTNTIAYTSFEADSKGRWAFSGTPSIDTTAVTGKQSYTLNGSNAISVSGLSSGQIYIVSYWTKNSSAFSITGTQTGSPMTGRTYNGWKYFEHKITGQTSVSINGSGQIDELRLYPATAQMSTYTYNPVMGITGQCDMDNRISYYFYDQMGRLRYIKDQDGNIVKTIGYHYYGQ